MSAIMITAPVRETAALDELALGAVRRALQRLPSFEQQLIALRFGGGMSISEISLALSLPDSDVALQLRVALRGMARGMGAQAASAIPSHECMRRALTGGVRPPSGLYEKVQRRIFQSSCKEPAHEQQRF